MIKRILAIHDLSGFGSSSLMAVIPIMHRYGIQTSVLPTALLSTNTCYPDFRYLDTTSFISDILVHYKELARPFNAIYSGFLGSPAQVDILLKELDKLSTADTLAMIDPVMADDGKLYKCYDESMIHALRRLISRADIISPNFTEACFLAGWDVKATYTDTELEKLCKLLQEMGPQNVIITSVPTDSPDNSRVLYYHPEKGLKSYNSEYIPTFYPGTGDVFSSLILAQNLNGVSLEAAISSAISFIYKAISYSIQHGEDAREGVLLEQLLWQ